MLRVHKQPDGNPTMHNHPVRFIVQDRFTLQSRLTSRTALRQQRHLAYFRGQFLCDLAHIPVPLPGTAIHLARGEILAGRVSRCEGPPAPPDRRLHREKQFNLKAALDQKLKPLRAELESLT
jgi:hypothetical protein